MALQIKPWYDHNAKFYYNTESLDVNEITKQCIDVLISYEILEVKILGVVSVGDGGNENCFRQMVDNSLIIGLHPNEKSVSFITSCDTFRGVYIWACVTLLLKVMWNKIYRSQTNLTCNVRETKLDHQIKRKNDGFEQGYAGV